MEHVQQILESHFKSGGWVITVPPEGKSRESYIARNTEHTVFVKLDVMTNGLQILSDLHIAPQVIASGEFNGRNYVIQEVVDGVHPGKEWLGSHTTEVSAVMKTYHGSVQLYDLLAQDHTPDPRQHMKEVNDSLLSYYSTSHDARVKTEKVKNALDILLQESKNIEPAGLVPTHLDPNPSNFIVSADMIAMIDWDDITLSDRMKDICLLLWRYIEKDTWDDFFREYGIVFDEPARKRFYWWLAQGSLNIAVWFSTQKDSSETQSYIDDFLQAVGNL